MCGGPESNKLLELGTAYAEKRKRARQARVDRGPSEEQVLERQEAARARRDVERRRRGAGVAARGAAYGSTVGGAGGGGGQPKGSGTLLGG